MDEIGRGTSPRDGARFAAAIFEAMSSRGMRGVFATHLHDILKLPLRSRERIITKQMAIVRATDIGEGTSYEWTYRLEDGVCNDSLATGTAKRFALPPEIIERADVLGQCLSSSRNDAFPSHDEKTTMENGGVLSGTNGHGPGMQVSRMSY